MNELRYMGESSLNSFSQGLSALSSNIISLQMYVWAGWGRDRAGTQSKQTDTTANDYLKKTGPI